MRIVVDTNVFVSGVFFSGPPYTILDAWRRGIVQIVASSEIVDEYRRVGKELAQQFSPVNLEPVLDLLAAAAITVQSCPLPQTVCRDPDDDKFLACAIAGKVRHVVSGDKALLATSGYAGITVLSPRQFVDKYLKDKEE
jgi:uncharacterized protein